MTDPTRVRNYSINKLGPQTEAKYTFLQIYFSQLLLYRSLVLFLSSTNIVKDIYSFFSIHFTTKH